MKQYFQVNIEIPPDYFEIVSAYIWDLNPEGVVEEDSCLSVFFRSDDNQANNVKELPFYTELQNLLNELHINSIIPSYRLESSTVENKNWNQEWENNRDIIKITNETDKSVPSETSIVICPTFKHYTPESNEIIIKLDPKMSFGTGEHQTTQIVLKLLLKYLKHDYIVLDVGTGTGILAIASVMLGAKSAIGIDNDEWCLLNAKENIKINNLSNIEIVLGELKDLQINSPIHAKSVDTDQSAPPVAGFDIILANIQRSILVNLVYDIKKRIKPSGFLILSGLLNEINSHPEISNEDDFKIITQVYQSNGFRFVHRLDQDEWMGLVFQSF